MIKESVYFLSGKIHLFRHVLAESFMLCGKQVIVEYQIVGVLAGRNRTLCILDAKLLCSVDRVSQQHLFYVHPFLCRR